MAKKKFQAQFNYDFIDEFKEGKAVVRLNGKYGYIDENGKEIIPPIYEQAKPFQNGVATVKFKNWWRNLDSTGKTLASQQEVEVKKEIEPQQKKETVQQKEITPQPLIVPEKKIELPKPTEYPIGENTLFLKKDKWGLKDREGKVLVAPRYKEVEPFAENKAMVRFGKKWGVIDKDGNELVAPIYEHIGQHGDLLVVKLYSAWQLIDSEGNKIGQSFYNMHNLFLPKNTLAAGYIDESGTVKQYEWD